MKPNIPNNPTNKMNRLPSSRRPAAPFAARLTLLLIALLATLSVARIFAAGDTLPQITASYPASVFTPGTTTFAFDATKGNHVMTPQNFGAVANDLGDDTIAFQKMFNWLYDQMKLVELQPNDSRNAPDAQFIMYIPNGKYLVNDTICYGGVDASGAPRDPWKLWRGVRIIGQSRAGTVIKLTDTNFKFRSGMNRPVLAFEHPDQDLNNWNAHNMLRNITIDVGYGNPGAVGVDFLGANSARIDNVTIMSEIDPTDNAKNYAGAIGLHLRIGIVHGYYSNITITGFDVGIKAVPFHHCCPAFEHITLTKQKIAGIEVIDACPTFRDVLSNQDRIDARGMRIYPGSTGKSGAHVVIIDSSFTYSRIPTTSKSAIEIETTTSDPNDAGHFFGRGITTSGYYSSIKKAGTVVQIPKIVNEWISDPKVTYNVSSPGSSMNLPIEEVPFVAWEPNANWACPRDRRILQESDDTVAVKDVVENSGKSVIYFPKQVYTVTATVFVPATVKRIDLMATKLIGKDSSTPFFDVMEDSPDPLVIENLNDSDFAPLVRLSKKRSLILDSNRQSTLINGNTTGNRIYVNNCGGFLWRTPLKDMRAWCRFINSEDKGVLNGWSVNWMVGDPTDGTAAVMWVLGYKCEGDVINFQAINGSWLEVLGGITNQAGGGGTGSGSQPRYEQWNAFNGGSPPYNAAHVNVDSNLSIVACTNDLPDGWGFLNLVGDLQNGVSSVPKMIVSKHNINPYSQPQPTPTPDPSGVVPIRASSGFPCQSILPLYLSYNLNTVPKTRDFKSIATEDGFVTAGGAVDNGTGFSAIRAGDNLNDAQLKGIVSFTTGGPNGLPSTAVIDSAVLWLKRGPGKGVNPFEFAPGAVCYVDIKKGAFSYNASLEAADFSAMADSTAALLSNPANDGEWATAIITEAAALDQINKMGANGVRTQLRISFSSPSYGNSAEDYMGWYSGESVGYEPRLVVTYHMP